MQRVTQATQGSNQGQGRIVKFGRKKVAIKSEAYLWVGSVCPKYYFGEAKLIEKAHPMSWVGFFSFYRAFPCEAETRLEQKDQENDTGAFLQ